MMFCKLLKEGNKMHYTCGIVLNCIIYRQSFRLLYSAPVYAVLKEIMSKYVRRRIYVDLYVYNSYKNGTGISVVS